MKEIQEQHPAVHRRPASYVQTADTLARRHLPQRPGNQYKDEMKEGWRLQTRGMGRLSKSRERAAA
ncbi:hypothetical protein E2C01_102051 [Portunus trituberculatus]|uniref:Uncharacterized protein n=1 Tax=Portunus trituberculatus TaxID=210409 RepID=A0A5B7KGC5_PORTR|nr:hypothetical protein [Portunus trituberculatus]